VREMLLQPMRSQGGRPTGITSWFCEVVSISLHMRDAEKH